MPNVGTANKNQRKGGEPWEKRVWTYFGVLVHVAGMPGRCQLGSPVLLRTAPVKDQGRS